MEENDGRSTTVILESIPLGTTSDEDKKLRTFSQSGVYLNVADKIHTAKRFETRYIPSRKCKRVLTDTFCLTQVKLNQLIKNMS